MSATQFIEVMVPSQAGLPKMMQGKQGSVGTAFKLPLELIEDVDVHTSSFLVRAGDKHTFQTV